MTGETLNRQYKATSKAFTIQNKYKDEKTIVLNADTCFNLCWKCTNQNFDIITEQGDFEIFKAGLYEGHTGLYYYIDQTTFKNECDSIQKTFENGAVLGDFF